MICVRKGYRVMKVTQSGVPLNRRFAFYDQIHTTGMDIKHRLGAHAALTLGKDMVFREWIILMEQSKCLQFSSIFIENV